MAKFEEKEMTKKGPCVRHTWYDWLIDYILMFRKNTRQCYRKHLISYKYKLMGDYRESRKPK